MVEHGLHNITRQIVLLSTVHFFCVLVQEFLLYIRNTHLSATAVVRLLCT